jgi:cell division protein FtsL
MTPTAVTPAARRARPATPASGSAAAAPPPRPSSVRSAKTPKARSTRTPKAEARSPRRASGTAAERAPERGESAPPKRSPQRASSARSAAHRPALRRASAPRSPRRVSGPAGGVGTLAAMGGAGSIAVPSPTRRRPRRPAPARRTVRLPRLPRPHVAAPSPAGLARATGAFVVSLPESTLLDRVIRGRIWIPLLGVLLVGIVAMQVAILKLNAGVGAAIQQTTSLQSRNDALRESVTGLSNEQRIETIAARHGMVMAPPDSVKFLHPGGSGYVHAAAANIHSPGSTYFVGPVGTSSAATAAASPGSSTTPVGG